MKDEHSNAQTYYDAASKSYSKLYDFEELMTSGVYPANYFRLQKLINAFSQPNIKRVIEIGLGEGTPALTLARAGKEMIGFDVSQGMVDEARARLRLAGVEESKVFLGDISDPITYVHAIGDGLFDGLVAMGVMQHMEKDEYVLGNMASLVRSGGKVFIMFRNKLFSLFTFNRYTHEFIVNDLLQGVDPDVRAEVSKYLASILRMDLPPENIPVVNTEQMLTKPVFSKFHNPFEVMELFNKVGFANAKLHWYHYHPAMPSLEAGMSDKFRSSALQLEHESSGWRGMFLCSAFVVEATRT